MEMIRLSKGKNKNLLWREPHFNEELLFNHLLIPTASYPSAIATLGALNLSVTHLGATWSPLRISYVVNVTQRHATL